MCRRWIFVDVAALLILALPCASHGVEHDAVTPYLGDDVLGVAYVDFTAIDLPAAVDEFAQLGIASEAELAEARKTTPAIQEVIGELPKRGGRRAYVLVRASDFVARGPTWVLEMADGKDAAAVVDLLNSWIAKATAERGFGDVGDILPKEFEVVGNVILGAPSRDRLDHVKAERRAALREDAAEALAAIGDADAGYVGLGDADTRRVIREMFPGAPPPFMELNGQFVADRLKWLAVALKLPPQPTLTVMVETLDEPAAETLDQAATKGLELLKAVCLSEAMSDLPVHKARALTLLPLVPLLKPKLDGTRLSLTLGDDPQEIEGFKKVVLPAVESARESARRAQRMNNFKQIALGMLNFESARKSLPTAASYDVDGKPLLSWRVLVLPYVEQMELYNQFHLDEPWDSEHNRKLIAKMPAIYADPLRPMVGGIEPGRTQCVVPVGEATLFHGREGTKLREIRDGTSNTILAVEATPERAVVWTKPDDWEVDLKDPLRGVKRDEGPGFIAAYCDGHVTFNSNSIDPTEFAKLLTRDGGETVQP